MTCLGSLIGFTNLGDINSHLQAYERNLEDESQATVANSMLVFLVQGLFSNLEFPYVQFPCVELSGEQMYDPFWECVSRLERCGFCVLALVSDGLAANRRLFKIHGDSSSSDIVYKVKNPYASDGRSLFFISDTPHLVKTIRNGWANHKRKLWVYAYKNYCMISLSLL